MEALCCLRSRPVADPEKANFSIPMEEKEDRVLEVEEPGEDFLNHVIVQLGVLKDKAQSTNKYKSADEFVPNKILIKPSIIFEAQSVVDAVKHFRKTFNINKKAFKGRVAATNAWGTAVFHPFLKDYYRGVRQEQTAQVGLWQPLHAQALCRCILQYLSNSNHSNDWQIRGPILLDFNRSGARRQHCDISLILQRCGVVWFQSRFKTPPDHLICLFAGQLKHLQATVAALKRKVEKEVPAVERVMSESASSEVGFLNSDGTVVILPKHTKRRLKTTTTESAPFIIGTTRLPASVRNLGKLGFGRSTVLLWQRYNKSIEDETLSSENEEDDN